MKHNKAEIQAPVWAKRTAASAASAELNIAYCAGRDVAAKPACDEALIPCDIWTNRVHCAMLARQKIITGPQCKKISAALARLEKDYAAGAFTLDPTLEDVHMNIERYVANAAGEDAAGVMHTARSRNDQSATDMRLWLRDQLIGRIGALAGTVAALGKAARKYRDTICLGWTHGQPAMPTTLGHWAAAHGAALARDGRALMALWPLINECPLGSAASFGTSWPVDRAWTAKQLGFDAPTPSSLDPIATRWEAEARAGAALGVMMTHLSSLGQDLIWLTTPPRRGVRLSDAHVTGSSIMPQKRNPDFAEVTRARALAAHHLASQLAGVGRGLLSGYNRDSQWTKYWIMDLFDETAGAPELFADVIAGMVVDREALRSEAVEGFSLAADFADYLARTRGIPFRRAYKVIGEAVADDEKHGWMRAETLNAIFKREKIKPPLSEAEVADAGNPALVLASRRSLGGPSPEDVTEQSKALAGVAAEMRRWAKAQSARLARLKQM